ncbi:MAG: response regulator, partial [Magnetococcales bacterium]|nr:response regulator [Magnetococcales bacterium]
LSRHARKRQAESEANFRLVVESSPYGIVLIDHAGRIGYMNPAMTRLLGYEREDAPDVETFWQRVCPDPDYRKWVLGTWNRSMNDSREGEIDNQPIEYQITSRVGAVRTMLIDSVAMGSNVLTTFFDITRQKEADHELRQAKEAAEAATRVKSDFLATMSHEIRTPMNVVIGMGDVLLESGINEEQMGYVRKLQRAGDNLLDLINQILDLSKIEAGRLRIEDEPVNVRAIMREVTGLLGMMVENKGLELECIVEEAVPEWVMSDRLRLHQVLLNLLSNAIKFTEQGRITLREKLEDPGQLHILVEDTGIGIAKEQLENIFDFFVQSDSGITRRYGGTGLGLAISRRLIDLMGGRIWGESQPGKGSTFHVVLPLRPVAPPVGKVTPEEKSDDSGLDGQAMRVLLVEDSVDNQLLIRTFLKNTPHRLAVAVDGREAVRMVQEATFDVVFMDVQMPVMDGYTATRRIRQWEQETGRPALPVVALTAHALNGEEERSREAGCDLYLNKPIKKQRLLEVIGQMGRRCVRFS